jgi:hypothetical protein
MYLFYATSSDTLELSWKGQGKTNTKKWRENECETGKQRRVGRGNGWVHERLSTIVHGYVIGEGRR